jgi:phosphoribosylformylglycinamidine cyclo-ligase
VPPLFQLIQEQSKQIEKKCTSFKLRAPWKCTFLKRLHDIIAISKSFNDAQIVGRVAAADGKKLTITSEWNFEY